ncbi:MAG: DUF2147 domain-containing protein [Taibaiella sp.]|nr:DUF2147 domain-containing protein [Taibaiella sp.]
MRISFLLKAAVLSVMSLKALAQDPIEHLWLSEEKTGKIQIYKATDGKFYGKLVWLKIPNEDGKPKVDKHNPDKAKRNDPILGMVLMRGFSKADDRHYEDGTIYDPKTGKTYSCKMTLNGDNLDVRGYMGISLIGKTTKWTKTD